MLVDIGGAMAVILDSISREANLAVLTLALTFRQGVRGEDGKFDWPVRNPGNRRNGVVNQWTKNTTPNLQAPVHRDVHVARPESDTLVVVVEHLLHHRCELAKGKRAQWISGHGDC